MFPDSFLRGALQLSYRFQENVLCQTWLCSWSHYESRQMTGCDAKWMPSPQNPSAKLVYWKVVISETLILQNGDRKVLWERIEHSELVSVTWLTIMFASCPCSRKKDFTSAAKSAIPGSSGEVGNMVVVVENPSALVTVTDTCIIINFTWCCLKYKRIFKILKK